MCDESKSRIGNFREVNSKKTGPRPHKPKSSGKASKRYANNDSIEKSNDGPEIWASGAACFIKKQQNAIYPAEKGSSFHAKDGQAKVKDDQVEKRVRIGVWNDKTFTWVEELDPNQPLPKAGMSEGRIKEVRGKWGFIQDSSCKSYDLFFHMTEVVEHQRQGLKKGTLVQYEIKEDPWRNERKNRLKAIGISRKIKQKPLRSDQETMWARNSARPSGPKCSRKKGNSTRNNPEQQKGPWRRMTANERLLGNNTP
jgi:cold shock CspA family protein